MTDQTPTTEAEPTPLRPARTRAPRRRTASRGSSTGFTATLRSQLAEQVKPCPHCGSPGGNKSLMAREIGVSDMTLNKFLKGGRANSDTIDGIVTYLDKIKGG